MNKDLLVDELTFARLFARYRERIDKNPTDLARELGVSPGYIFNIEAGRGKPTEEIFAVAAKRFHLKDESYQEFRKAWLYMRANKEGRELMTLQSGHPFTASAPQKAVPIRYVPVLANVPAGDPRNYTDGDYPVGFAEEFRPVPADLVCSEPHAFILRIEGDSMSPRLNHGDMVLVGPDGEVVAGKPAVVKIDGEITCKLWFARGDKAILRPVNQEYREREVDLALVDWAYPVILEMKKP